MQLQFPQKQPKRLQTFLDSLSPDLKSNAEIRKHSTLEKWILDWEMLPNVVPSLIDLKADTVTIGQKSDISEADFMQLEAVLRRFMPWRKGPFSFFGHFIDTEWRSDWKWQRILPHLPTLRDKLILDVGCGSGYHLWKMAAEEARCVIGLEPMLIYVMQFQLFKKYLSHIPAYILPHTLEQIPQDIAAFNIVFDMGVLYHRKSPFDHLLHLKSCLKEGGSLVLETLIIDGKMGEVLVPEGRYAQMNNVWFLPSALTLESWLKKCKFKNIRLVDINQTSILEQRRTDWMVYDSLAQFLAPNDFTKTVEGYPAPLRATFICEV